MVEFLYNDFKTFEAFSSFLKALIIFGHFISSTLLVKLSRIKPSLFLSQNFNCRHKLQRLNSASSNFEILFAMRSTVIIAFVSLVVIQVATGIVYKLAARGTRGYEFSEASSLSISEMVKLLVSLVLLKISSDKTVVF